MNTETSSNRSSDRNLKADVGTGMPLAKKPYSAPQIIEHGTVEQMTGFLPVLNISGMGPTPLP